jgi:hypothetical protein
MKAAVVAALATLLPCVAQSLLPMPAKLTVHAGRLSIDRTFSVAVTGVADPRITNAVQRLIARIGKKTGLPLLSIHCEQAGAPVQKLGEDESYKLVTDGGSSAPDRVQPARNSAWSRDFHAVD